MAANPTFVDATALQTGGSTVTVPWPSHQTDDLGILFALNNGYDWNTLPSGWTVLGGFTIAGTATKILWRAATSGAMSSPVIGSANPSAVSKGLIVTVRGARIGAVAPFGGQGLSDSRFLAGGAGGNVLVINDGTPINMVDGFAIIWAAIAQSVSLLSLTSSNSALNSNLTSLLNTLGFGQIKVGPLDPSNVTITSATATFSSSSGDAEGFVLSVLPAIVESPFAISGSSSVSMTGERLFASAFTVSAGATVSNPGNVNRESAFTITAGATVSNPGARKVASAFTITAGALVENPGGALVKSAFVITGSSSMVMSGASDGSSSFVIASSSAMNMVGAALAESSFDIQGSSFVDMKAPQAISSSFSIVGSSSVQMYSPTLTITTLQNGSGGDPNGGSEIDWTICDFVNIELTAGVGSYPIDHVNLIAGKKISVHVRNNSGATGFILWDGGDAPVNWIGMSAPPAMPANGETLHVEFECNAARTEIFGRLFVDETIQDTLNGLNRRFGRTLFDHVTDAANVGANETTLYSDLIVGGTLSANGDKVLAEFAVEFTASANTKQIKLYFPTSVVVFDTGSLAITAATDCDVKVLITRKTVSTARAVVVIGSLPVTPALGHSQITDEAILTGLNFDLDNLLKVTGTGGVSGDITAKLGFVEFKPSAV